MPLTLTKAPPMATGRTPGELAERYFVCSGELTCGIIQKRHWQPNDGHWDWSFSLPVGTGPAHVKGMAATLEDAKEVLHNNFRSLCTWAGLKEVE